ncbi:RsmB/NOP family class I SAM-dependent RNA methyltransferase [Sphingomonas sp.]|uniref:RsmB/NOP family class I SAM-dependent RNA methyltransferase n=1 Tax=Sphingomonas sp. TaxID=28214 RepID=UPI003B3A27DE
MTEHTSSDPQPAGVAARAAALRLLEAVLRRGLPLESALDNATRGLDRADDRALAHALAAEVLRRLTDLDALIDSATAKPLPTDAKARFVLRIALAQALQLGTPPHAAISTVLPLVDGGPRRLVHGVFGALMRKGVRLPDQPTLPDGVALRWHGAWGDAMLAAAESAIAAPPPLDLTLRDAGSIWVDTLGGESLAPGHVRLPAGARVTELPGFAEGGWWVQDISASLPARLIGQGKGRALDLCAAPGGKTMQLAAAGWTVTAVDMAEPRLKRVRDNLKRTKLEATLVTGDALTFADDPYDAVLLDAPCSATGIFRRHPDVLYRARPRAIAGLAEQQRAMLARAASLVKPSGVLVYSVCSLEPEEGERNAAAFLESHGGFVADPVSADELPAGIAPDGVGQVRVLPGVLADKGGADGFFVARFRRK